MKILADIVWPAAFMVLGGWSLWGILAGLLIEWPIVKWLLGLRWMPSFGATLIINLASAMVGTLLVLSLSGFLLVPLSIFWPDEPTFSPTMWVLSFVFTLGITTCVEVAALALYSKTALFKRYVVPYPTWKKVWPSLIIANTLSIGVLIWVVPNPGVEQKQIIPSSER